VQSWTCTKRLPIDRAIPPAHGREWQTVPLPAAKPIVVARYAWTSRSTATKPARKHSAKGLIAQPV